MNFYLNISTYDAYKDLKIKTIMNEFDADYQKTVELMQAANSILSNARCEKCNVKNISYDITTDRQAKYDCCCDELKENIELQLKQIGFIPFK